MGPQSVKELVHLQRGVIARRQLLAGGMSSSAIARRVRSGLLVVVYSGVYAVGHGVLTVEGRRFAAVLACGPTALAGMRTAGAAWGLVASAGSRWEVIVPRMGPRAPSPQVRVYRRASLLADERTTLEGLPITTVARTLFDLSTVVGPVGLRRAVEHADALELFDLVAVTAVLDAHRGAPVLRAFLADAYRENVTLTRSDLEARFLQLCIDQTLPRPVVNRFEGGTEVDFSWPGHRLRVEVDGWRWHRSRGAFTDDRARDRHATLAGERTLRYTHADVVHRGATVVRELRAALTDAH